MNLYRFYSFQKSTCVGVCISKLQVHFDHLQLIVHMMLRGETNANSQNLMSSRLLFICYARFFDRSSCRFAFLEQLRTFSYFLFCMSLGDGESNSTTHRQYVLVPKRNRLDHDGWQFSIIMRKIKMLVFRMWQPDTMHNVYTHAFFDWTLASTSVRSKTLRNSPSVYLLLGLQVVFELYCVASPQLHGVNIGL